MDNYEYKGIVANLRKFAKSIGVQIRLFDNNKTMYKQGYKACYNIQTRVVLLNKKSCSSKEEIVYTIAHELGHAIDLDKETPAGLEALKTGWERYTQIANSGKRVPRPVQDFVLEREHAAFAEGNKVLLQLGINLPGDLRETLEQENDVNYLSSFNLDADE